MVKNKTGGNKAKKFGRKHMQDEPLNVKVRFVTEEGEIYGVISKVFGQGQLEVTCHDGVIRHGILRKKFRGRYKHDNKIVVGAWVMVGLRDWQSKTEGKKEHCDILEVYNEDEKAKLLEQSQINLKGLKQVETNLTCLNASDDNQSPSHMDEDSIFFTNTPASSQNAPSAEDDESVASSTGDIDFDDI